MTTGEFDSEDAPGFAAIVLGAIGLTEIGTISIYGFSLSDTAFSLGGTGVTWAALLVVAGAVWISITNEVASFVTGDAIPGTVATVVMVGSGDAELVRTHAHHCETRGSRHTIRPANRPRT